MGVRVSVGVDAGECRCMDDPWGRGRARARGRECGRGCACVCVCVCVGVVECVCECECECECMVCASRPRLFLAQTAVRFGVSPCKESSRPQGEGEGSARAVGWTKRSHAGHKLLARVVRGKHEPEGAVTALDGDRERVSHLGPHRIVNRELLFRLNHSPNARHTTPSTPHAARRARGRLQFPSKSTRAVSKKEHTCSPLVLEPK
jgi:hypothetical protein